MRSMKRTLTLLLSAVLVVCAALCVAGCGGQQASSSATSSAASSSAASEAGKTLVVYFSATGNTEAVVQDIVDETGATSFAIQPAQPYTSEDLDYNDPDSRVSKEHADPSLQDVALAQDTPDDWASYNTVLIGYSIWWGEAAYPVASFAKANDFTGKTVIPFCTSASSGLGQSAEHLSELANGGEWMGGMRFPSGVNGDEVRQWVDDLGLEKQNL